MAEGRRLRILEFNEEEGLQLRVAIMAPAPGPSHSLEIDFSGAPDVMVGSEVLVDGSVVGQLRPEGSRNVATFKVMAGDRTVELRKEGYGSEAFKFIALESETTVLEVSMAAWLVDGEIKNSLILR